MLPHIFYVNFCFKSTMSHLSVICRLLLNRFHILQGQKIGGQVT
jgi:hypothetical protein